ncbi:MAG: hypothetical protein H6742_00280 [Alphaproteobacteria bacterium]|nr:hypothetical protein [Alphaproteobacteria bacterium]
MQQPGEEIDDPRATAARVLAEQGRWEEAARVWHALAVDLEMLDPGAAAQCLLLAADALRREDQLWGARELLQRGQARVGSPVERAMFAIEQAGVVAELDGPTAARALLDEVLREGCTDRQAVLAQDLRVGLLLEALQLDAAEAAAVAIPVPVARDYRLATVHRVRGRLGDAQACLRRVRAAMSADPAWDGPRAALESESAEQALLLGEPDAALAAAQEARALWTRARRRAGLMRAAALEARARVALGQAPLTAELDRALDYAADRRLAALRVEILFARGAVRRAEGHEGAAVDLRAAADEARALGAHLTEGRVLATLLDLRAGGSAADGQRAAELLRDTAWAR